MATTLELTVSPGLDAFFSALASVIKPAADPRVDLVLAILKTLETHMSVLDDKIADLTASVTAEQGAVDSAIILINGISQRVADAVTAALAAGATPAELQSLTDLRTSLDTQTTALASAVAANP